MRTASVLVAALFAVAVGASAQGPSGIARAAWLQGCWQTVSSGATPRTVDEQWMAPLADSMLGMSRTVRGERLLEYELILLRVDGDQLVYRAHPSGQRAAEFRSVVLEDTRLVFENTAHDFPQRIGYELEGRERLSAWIEGTRQGQNQRVGFKYRRVPCPG